MKPDKQVTMNKTPSAPETQGKRRVKNACEKIAQIARQTAGGVARIEQLNELLQLEQLKMRELGDAASSSEGIQRRELLMRLGEQALRVSDVNNELQAAVAANEQEQSRNRTESKRCEVEIDEGRIEEAEALLGSARELMARAKALLG